MPPAARIRDEGQSVFRIVNGGRVLTRLIPLIVKS
jgi:hypothetical protein